MKFENIKQDKFKFFSGNELKNPKFCLGGIYIRDGVGNQANMSDYYATMTASLEDCEEGAMTVHVNDTYNERYGNP